MEKINRAPQVLKLAFLHGLYFFITGIWPILHMPSFIAITGPKTDLWLVRTVGMLVLAIGIGLMMSALRKFITLPVIVIGTGAAFGFTLIDIIYVVQNVISPIYLLDACIEIIFLVLWSGLFYQAGNNKSTGT